MAFILIIVVLLPPKINVSKFAGFVSDWTSDGHGDEDEDESC